MMETGKRARWRDDYDERLGDALPPELPCLPPEMIREILLRLPAKSIGRFRCVSKLFRSLSSDPKFAKTHLDLSLRNDALRSARRRLVVSYKHLYTVSFDSIVDTSDGTRDLGAVEIPESPVMVNFVSSYYQDGRRIELVGTCNGLVCTTSEDAVTFLFNLTTRESKEIPGLREFLDSVSKEETFSAFGFGFGFDAITDDYKVVALVTGDVLNASVYSLKTGSWKLVGDSRYEYANSAEGLLVNGAIHWFALHEEDDRLVVVAFDLATEQFKDMALPDEAEDCAHGRGGFELHKLNGRLCMVYTCCENHDDFWVMNEYGVASSWARVRISVQYDSMKPLCSGKKEEETLMEINGQLVLCNFRNDTSTSLVLKDAKLRCIIEADRADTYIESLISPNSYGGV
ncbi:PREDICTED: F-box/kelch-repeat protein At3g06240-like [Tarenaya hassleriana]|uniref:F-box/kelch-repeat protein At3g06240-like n=1 Tax=Tarenaya hassleriana TaxID=28532 RepID=UPI00053C0DDB|nr:PREDICTED: F-box/kelch-repeat protein At3g06240-like [Tarenaya hassleriana]